MMGMEILGLVGARRGSGVYVTGRPSGGLHASELDIGAFELTEARRLIEGECAALAAVTADAAAIASLRESLDALLAENENELHAEVADRPFPLHNTPATTTIR